MGIVHHFRELQIVFFGGVDDFDGERLIDLLLCFSCTVQTPRVPFRSIALSLPFYAILFAHMGQNYGYETLLTELPTYMNKVLQFSIKEVSVDMLPRS